MPYPAKVPKPQSVEAITRSAPDDGGKALDPLRDQFGMLDIVGTGVDHAGGKDLVIGNFGICPHFPFMFVARIGGLEQDRCGARLQDDVDHLFERNVMIVRPFIIAPAHMHPHFFRRDIGGRGVQRLDILFGDADEFLVAQILKAGVARHGEIGAIELEEKALARQSPHIPGASHRRDRRDRLLGSDKIG